MKPSLKPQKQNFVILYTTTETKKQASDLAETLLLAKLAFCIQSDTIISRYVWEDKLQTTEEVRVCIKTTSQHLPEIAKIFAEQHPYDVPQWLVVDCLPQDSSYSKWALEAVKA